MGEPLTGKLGAVNGVSEVANWSITSSVDLKEVYSSSTKGAPVVLDGNKDWNGTYKSYGHTPPVMPGEDFTFTGSVDGSKGASGPAICDSISVTVNIAAANPIEYTTNFSGDGALVLGAAVAADAATPNPPSALGCKVATFDGSAEAVLENVTDYTFTITADNKPYNNSSTAGATKRLVGNLSAEATYNQECADFDALPALNSAAEYRFYVGATEYWAFKKMKVSGHTPKVDIETAAVLAAGVNLQFTGFAAGQQGYIKTPDQQTFWPPTP